MSKSKTHYDNLKVSRGASHSQIRAAYRKLAQKYHPDKFAGSAAEANRVMRILNHAKTTLLDPAQRRAYDQRILERENEAPSPSRQRAPQDSESARAREQWRAHQAELQRQARAAKAAAGAPPRSARRAAATGSGFRFLAFLAGAGFLTRGLTAIGGALLVVGRRASMVPLAIAGPLAVLALIAGATLLLSDPTANLLQSPAQAKAVQALSPAPISLLEVKPTAGFDLDRSPEQIRYCLSEDIRVEAIRSSLDSYSQFEIDRLHSAVVEYNSLCSRYSYRPTAFEIAKNDVTARRLALVSEGLARLTSWRRLATPLAAPLPGYGSTPGRAYSPSDLPAANLPETLLPGDDAAIRRSAGAPGLRSDPPTRNTTAR